mmetsp:Transcript_1809/g.2663  ORF Transcript_1809/g.2663 Transcript_1809/m.2663 type:complete len:551 (-) Transcript_1809:441-2093(-)|eukprot:CAMPEP_0194222266 /NCGR_PEP_ID=MMETSP0156-20130528/32505_1 /TAXON_ID=33649 /ORGANISM="Thalassionema nitzschioides, Strain L26-B" /LENGTH=550 /DNA_ID=CAMNT_0038952981 /DNA_START=35 /DNA_END=1687 /DNA_ORIENTATION=+
MTSTSDEEAIIDREFSEQGSDSSESEEYSTYLSSGEDDSIEYSSSENSPNVSNRGDSFLWQSRMTSPLSVLRRRPVNNSFPTRDRTGQSHEDDYKPRPPIPYTRYYHKYYKSLKKIPINLLFVMSFLIWLSVRLIWVGSPLSQAEIMRALNAKLLMQKLSQKRYGRLTPGEISKQRTQEKMEARKMLGSGTGKGIFGSLMGSSQKKKKRAEDLDKGCDFLDWQKQSFPTCNEIHEIDLRSTLHLKKKSTRTRDVGTGIQRDVKQVGYVGSGLWRHVWKVDPRDEATSQPGEEFQAPCVFKMMKSEHDVNYRNMDRHRRDALVMERLTASPHIVSIYSYCGNTVLTEYAGFNLEDIISDKHSILSNENVPSRKSTRERLYMALGVAKGVEAMHTVEGGPIIHADITSEQFLVNNDGHIKLNDFNRCRFIPRHNLTGMPCQLRIPSAPGVARSPEEYEMTSLTEKLDVYSLANVLYTILTGEEPWKDKRVSDIKKLVKQGSKPPYADKYLITNTSDASLAAIIDLAYERDPDARVSARELVNELELLIGNPE